MQTRQLRQILWYTWTMEIMVFRSLSPERGYIASYSLMAVRYLQCWALPQTGPQVRKSANCGLKVLVCGFANRFLTANICGFAVKKLKSTANPQINNITEIVSAISKQIRFHNSMHRQIWVDVFLMYNTSHQDPLLRNDYFPEVLLFLQQNELA